MDSFELNKILGAILGTLLFVMGAGFLAEAIYEPIEGRGPGYELPMPEGITDGPDDGEPVVVDLGTLLAAANVQQGESVARRCISCHSFDESGANKQGPGLYGVAGRPIASHAGYAYSPAMMAHASDTWTYENLSAFLHSPREFVPDTKMSFGGVKDDVERANLLAYLASVTPNAPAFPAPAPADNATAEAEAATTPAPEGEPAVATDADAVATPTETQSETQVEGTATSAPAGATEAAPTTEAPAMEAPATEAPAMDAPAATTTTTPSN